MTSRFKIGIAASVAAFFLSSTAYAQAHLRGVTYAVHDGISLRLDGEIPRQSGAQPLAILVHGGSWSHGTRNSYIGPLKALLTRAHIAWVAIDFRLAPRYRFPADLMDVEAAIRWAKAHAGSYHIDPDRLVLIGESSGGQLVALVGAQDKPETHVAAIIDMYGPNDLSIIPNFLPEPPQAIKDLLGITAWTEEARTRLAEASPQHFVKPGLPPFLFIHGTADTLVPPAFSDRMCEALKASGNRCDVIHVPGAIHGMENWEAHPEQLFWKQELVSWINKTLGTTNTTRAE